MRAASTRAASPRAARLDSADAEVESLEDGDPAIEERFEALKEWRRGHVRESGLPAYTVLNDETLRLLASRRIASMDDIARVKGVGPAKLERYGAELLELLGE